MFRANKSLNAENNKLLKKLLHEGRYATIRVHNSEAVCLCDPAYYTCEINELLNQKHILRELSKGSSYQIGGTKKLVIHVVHTL